MEDAADFWVCKEHVYFFRGKSNVFMAEVVNPSFIGWRFQDVATTVVIGLDWKRFGVLVKWDFVVVNGYFEVFAGDSFVHDDAGKLVDGVAGVKDIVYKKDFVASAQIFWGIGPAVYLDAGLVAQNGVGTSHNCGVKYGSSMLFETNHLEVFREDVGHVNAAAEGDVNDIWNKAVFFMHLIGEFKSTISNNVVWNKVFHSGPPLLSQMARCI